MYQDLWGRITHLCHSQGSFARLRGLSRADVLLELDRELKERTEGLLQTYRKMRAERKQARMAKRNHTRRGRMASDPSTSSRQPNGAQGSPAQPRSNSLNAREHSNAGPSGCFQSGGFQGRVRGEPTQGAEVQQPPGRVREFTATGRDGFGSGMVYTPHYLKPSGEGANFYSTLPEPWNVLPEHSPTPLTQVPQMQKAGCFTEFDGQVQSYRSFRGSFIDGCHRLDLPISAKYTVLKACLAAHKILTDLVNTTCPSTSGYRSIILTLEERYGHTGVLLTHHLHKLTELPRVRETVIEDLDCLVDTAHGYEMARQASGARSKVDPTYFNLVKSKLPDKLRREYAKYCREEHIPATDCDVGLLINWIKVYVAEPLRLEPPTRKQETRTENRNDRTFRRQEKHYNQSQGNSGSGFQPGNLDLEKKYNFYTNNAPGNGSNNTNHSSNNPSLCVLCKSGHRLKDCPEFLAANLPKRFDILKELNCCFRCLTPSHIAASCPYQALCTKCKGEHHSLLHVKRRNPPTNTPSNPTRTVRFAAPLSYTGETENNSPNYMPRQDEFLNHARMQIENKDYNNYLYAVRGDSPVSLCFQWVQVTNPINGKAGLYNIMQDPGAQFTAISELVVRQLQLKGVTRRTTVEGVGGVKSIISSLPH